jgi:type IV pilus assembly protein PilQ
MKKIFRLSILVLFISGALYPAVSLIYAQQQTSFDEQNLAVPEVLIPPFEPIMPEPQPFVSSEEPAASDLEPASLPEQTAPSVEKPIPSMTAKVNNDLVSLNLKDVPIKDALKIIASASNMNIIFDNNVTATVTITIKDVPWQTALDNILTTNQLTYMIQDNIIRVMTLETLKKEGDFTPLSTKILSLSFAKAEVLKTSLMKLQSSRGSIDVDVPTNSLIISDTPTALANVEEMAKKLDICTPQVMIETLIMSVKLSNSNQFGMEYTANNTLHPERKVIQNLQAPASNLDILYGKTIIPSWDFSATLSLFSQDKNVKILANPRILTLDNLSAQIEITEQVPYTYTSTTNQGTVTSTQFKDTGIKLFVTPHVTKDKYISLAVKAEQSFVASFVGSTNEPSVDSRKAETNFMLKDGDTVVIGGLRKKDETITRDKVPILGDIPFLGRIFRKDVKEIIDTELVIFVTPHIIMQPQLSESEKNSFDASKTDLSREKNLAKMLDGFSKSKNKK